MDITSVVNLLKLPKKVIFLMAILSTIILFSSQSFIEQLSLYELKEKYKTMLGIIFLLTVTLSGLNIFESFFNYIQSFWKRKKNKKLELVKKEKFKKEYQQKLANLDNDELVNIREFYILEKNTIEMVATDSAVKGLIKKGIILNIGNSWSSKLIQSVYSFELSVWAKEYFDNFNFNKLDNIDKPLWVEKLKIHHQNNSKLLKSMNNLFTEE